MLKHSVYFEGKVQSVGFERNGRGATVGVVDAGEFHFGTEAAERMTVVSGELWVRQPGAPTFRPYAAGTTFEIPGKSGFDVKAELPTAYLCEYL
jgi:purine/pyrimidine-nucleoside phosphorylase